MAPCRPDTLPLCSSSVSKCHSTLDVTRAPLSRSCMYAGVLVLVSLPSSLTNGPCAKVACCAYNKEDADY